MTRTQRWLAASKLVLDRVQSQVDARDLHFYGGLLLAYLGARALSPAFALLGLGIVLMLTGLLIRERKD